MLIILLKIISIFFSFTLGVGAHGMALCTFRMELLLSQSNLNDFLQAYTEMCFYGDLKCRQGEPLYPPLINLTPQYIIYSPTKYLY